MVTDAQPPAAPAGPGSLLVPGQDAGMSGTGMSGTAVTGALSGVVAAGWTSSDGAAALASPAAGAARRRWWRSVLVLVAATTAVGVLLVRADASRSSLQLLTTASPGWSLGCLAAVAATNLAAAWRLSGATSARLRFGRSVEAQLAGGFVNRLAPSGLGGAAVNTRYLQRHDMGRTEAVAAMTMVAAAGIAVEAAAFVALLPFFGGFRPDIDPPDDAAAFSLVAAALVAIGALLWVRVVPRRWKVRLGDLRRTLGATLRSPRRRAVLLGGSAGLTVAHCLALWCSVRAVGAPVPLADAAIVYLAASAVGKLSPTPAGLGALDAALLTGLNRVGLAAHVAASAVILYRLLSFWAPVAPGAVAFRRLRRRGVL